MFNNLKEFMATMPDEKQCREYMEKARWGDSPFCPHCNSTKPYKLKDGKKYRCSSPKCRKDFTVTVGTIIENTKIDLYTWLNAIFTITGHRKGISSLQLSRNLGCTQSTAWFMLHRIRFIMETPQPVSLEGTVEIDEFEGDNLRAVARNTY